MNNRSFDEWFSTFSRRKNRGGSKLNETARSYKAIAEAARGIEGFAFVWITDGKGWRRARGNLQETFLALPTLYNIRDMEDGIFLELFNE